jgi:hypothetical protein
MKESLINSFSYILATYRSIAASIAQPGEIAIPDQLGYMPLGVLAMLKNPALRLLGETKVDEKFAWVMKLLSLPMAHFIRLSQPRIYPIHDISET